MKKHNSFYLITCIYICTLIQRFPITIYIFLLTLMSWKLPSLKVVELLKCLTVWKRAGVWGKTEACLIFIVGNLNHNVYIILRM